MFNFWLVHIFSITTFKHILNMVTYFEAGKLLSSDNRNIKPTTKMDYPLLTPAHQKICPKKKTDCVVINSTQIHINS